VRDKEERLEQVPEPDEPIRLTPEEEEELSEAVEQIRQGNYVDGQTLLDELVLH
jgi:hypothetical protein